MCLGFEHQQLLISQTETQGGITCFLMKEQYYLELYQMN